MIAYLLVGGFEWGSFQCRQYKIEQKQTNKQQFKQIWIGIETERR